MADTSYCGREGFAPQPPNLCNSSTIKKVINFVVEDDDFKTKKFIDENEENNFPLTSEQKTARKNIEENCILPSPELLMSDKPLQNQKSTEWSNECEGEYVADSKPPNSDSGKEEGSSFKDFKAPMPVVPIKQNNYDEDDNYLEISTRMGTCSAVVKYEDEEDHSFGENDRIFDTTNTYSAEIKCENEECNLFDKKGRILESLVNENDNSELTEVGLDKSNNQYNITRQQRESEKNYSQDSDDIIKEAKVVYEVSDDQKDGREDILEEVYKATEVTKNNIRDGCVLPEGVTNCFPSLKDTSTLNVPCNVQTLDTKRINVKPKSRYVKYYRVASISKKQLLERMRPNKSRQCPECSKNYSTRKPFEMHLRNHHKKSEDFIKEIFRNDLEKVSAEVFKCHICDKVYLVEKRLLSHIRKHGPDGTKVHKCSCCTLYYATREEATAHAHEKHKDLLWCGICEKFMITHHAFNSHKARIHGGKKVCKRPCNLMCTKCGKKFVAQTALTNHERSDCGCLALYQCQECGKSFIKSGILKSHMTVHNDARPYKCDKCGKTFKLKCRYEKHIKPYHLDKRHFKCLLCPKEYPCRQSFLTHMSEHTDINQQAETRGSLPLKTEATKCMEVQRGNLLTSVEPELGLDCVETRRFVAKEVITHDFDVVEDVDVKAKEFIDEDEENNFPIKPEQKTKVKNIDGNISPEVLLSNKLLQNQKRIQRSYDGEDEYIPDFEPADSSHSDHDREDILKKATEVTKDDIRDCYVLLEDVTNWFPSLKNASTVNVPPNVQPLCSISEKITKIIEERRECRLMRTKGINTELDSKESKSRKYGWASVSGKKVRECIRRDKPRQCPDCIKIYYRRKPFEMHLRNDHKKSEDFIREIFKTDFEEVSADAFKCHICDKVYLLERWLLFHILKHGADGTKVHKCSCCTLYFTTREEATAHAQEKHKNRLWCRLCEKFMISTQALLSHNARLHGGKKYNRSSNLVCTKCGKKFMVLTLLIDHQRSECGRLSLYQCQKCGKSLRTAGILKSHMLLHNDAVPYQCDKCGKTFKIKGRYKSHIKYYHLDKKRFKCQLCPKEYRYRQKLLIHMSVHTKATECMELQKSNLLTGAKPELGLGCVETKTFVAQKVVTDYFDVVEDDDVEMKEFIDEDEKNNFPNKTDPKLDNIQNESLGDFEYTSMDIDSAEVKYEDEENHSFVEKDHIFETMDTCSAEMKYEAEEYNLCDNNDRIFEHILNKNDFSEFAEVGLEKSNNQSIIKRQREKPERNDSQDSDDILKEAKVVYEVSDDQEDNREDILEEVHKATEITKDHIRDCYVLLEDVTNCFPLLKETCTVKVPSNVQPSYYKSKKITKHGPDDTLVHECPCHCSLYFKTRVEATAHAQQKHKNILWCELCEKFMASCEALNSHKAQTHGGNMNYKCSRSFECLKCGKKFRELNRLTDHERSDCGRLPLYQCQTCGKCLATARSLKTHILLHNDATPYQCDKCGKSFKIQRPYRKHIKYDHNDEKRYKCHVCAKQYSHREGLLSHMHLHTGIKRYKCYGCGKCFTGVSCLIKHRRIRQKTCARLPLNTKAIQYMGVQNGKVIIGAKPTPGSNYMETGTYVANGLCPENT